MLFYFVWQAVYLFLTEHVLADYIRSDPEIIISMRYLARDKKNVMHKLVKRISRRLGIMGKDEDYQPESLKTKAIFLVAQFLYTMLTLLPTPFLYSSYHLSLAWFALLYGWCIWRGASFYIEIFSERYKLKFVTADSPEVSDDDKDDHDGEEVDHEELYKELFTAIREAEVEETRGSTSSSDEEEQLDGRARD